MEWNYSRHAVPQGIDQFGLYDEDGKEIAIVKAGEDVARLIAETPCKDRQLALMIGVSQMLADRLEEVLRFNERKLPQLTVDAMIETHPQLMCARRAIRLVSR